MHGRHSGSAPWPTVQGSVRAAHGDNSRRPDRHRVDERCDLQLRALARRGLRGASAADLAEVEVSGVGLALHWERLDVDYSVAGLLNDVFGTRTWMDGLQVAEAAE